MVYYSITNWNECFENSNTGRIKGSLSWVPIPTKHDGKSYKRLMRMKDGFQIYAAWLLIVQVAAKCPIRGVLTDRDGPLTAEDLHFKTDGPIAIFERALEVLSSEDIGWMQRHTDANNHLQTQTTVVADKQPSANANNHLQPKTEISKDIRPTEQNRTEHDKFCSDQSPDRPAFEAGGRPVGQEASRRPSVFDKLFEFPDRLKDPAMMRDWVHWQAKQRKPVIRDPTPEDAERVVATALQASREAENPPAFFAAAIGKKSSKREKHVTN